MKTEKINIPVSLLMILLIASLSWAGNSESSFEPGTLSYTPPVLKQSVRPEPVSYAPGRVVEGYVTLELKIGTSGDVEGVTVLYRTSVIAVKSAVKAVEQWEFKPATLNGEAVTSFAAYSVPFGQNLQIFANENYIDRIIDPANGDQIAMK